MSAGVRAPRKALQSCLRAGRSPHLRDTEEQDRDARCPASSGSRAAFLFAGRRSPCSPQRRRLLLSFLSCHNQKRLLPPPTGSAPARYGPKEVPTCTVILFPWEGVSLARLPDHSTQPRVAPGPAQAAAGRGLGWERRPCPCPQPQPEPPVPGPRLGCRRNFPAGAGPRCTDAPRERFPLCLSPHTQLQGTAGSQAALRVWLH